MRLTPTATPNLRLLLILILAAINANCCAQSIPLLNGFAHNDYRHKHPLFDALDNGYTNIEADIFLRDTNLVVAHICPMFREGKTLEKLYLKPLFDRVRQNNGRVYSNYMRPVILMIDVKSGSDNTYRQLERLLDKYRSMLTSYDNGTVIYRAVTVVISGHKPYGLLEGETNRLAFIDDDLRKVARDTVMRDVFTMASCKYSRLISWDGKGIIPVLQQQRLCAFVAMAHSMGAKVRLWASPERKVVWDELLKCGVDLINTDQLVTLRNYLNANTVALAKVN
ncbi:MAG: phosphatidylinositol-specific phospholipase C/glycerophosphodiester phosphodiesterase family protein [Sphingobacteriales bacterium]